MKRLLLLASVLATQLAGVSAPARAAEPQIVDACPPVPTERARCYAQIVKDGDATTSTAGDHPVGFTPSQIKTAYGFPTSRTAGAGQTVAIVGAFDSPNVEADLAKYSSRFGLPRCTTANGCFTKLNSRGVTPAADTTGWSLEASMDVELVHAIAPGAKVLLVQASSDNFVDLFQAVQFATQQPNVRYLSASWGNTEFELQSIFDPLLQVAGISEFFSAGDIGGLTSFPATSPDVIGVGGTRLKLNADGKKYSEVAWNNGGGGCSAYYDASAAQAALTNICGASRATPDIAAVGDPVSGFAVYTSSDFFGHSGWNLVAGTSAGAPLMAARAAVTGVVWDQAYVYSNARKFFDVVWGYNGFYAGPGFDLATGRGRWRA